MKITLEQVMEWQLSGQYELAEMGFNHLLKESPQDIRVLNGMGAIKRARGEYVEALKYYLMADAIQPDSPPVLYNMAQAYSFLEEYEQAEYYGLKTIKVAPESSNAFVLLGGIYHRQHKYAQALDSYKTAIKMDKDNPTAHNNLGETYWRMGKLDECLESYKRTLEIDPTQGIAWSNMILSMNYSDTITQGEIIKASQDFANQFMPAVRFQFQQEFQPPDPLRVGFISPHLRANPVGRFLMPIFKNHLKGGAIEFHVYSDVAGGDAITNVISEGADSWTSVVGRNNWDVANMIYRNKIHILFDLSGHIGGNRLQMFMMKPAPIQVEWMGYFNTTQINEMDFFLVDEFCVPPECDHLYSEKIIRMPGVYECWEPEEDTPDVVAPPMMKNGYPTFVCQQQLAKITDTTVEVWSSLLRSFDGAKLILRANGLKDQSTADYHKNRFKARGVKEETLDFRAYCPQREYFETYNEADLALAPIPFTGITTACDALWMGVPTVVLLGDTVPHRQAGTSLNVLGHSEYLAKSKEDYKDIARGELLNYQGLKETRKTLRDKMKKSVLCDGRQFYNNFIDVLWKMWRGGYEC